VSASRLVANLGPCPKRYVAPADGSLNPGVRGLRTKLVVVTFASNTQRVNLIDDGCEVLTNGILTVKPKVNLLQAP
jgi:hypothetical protein